MDLHGFTYRKNMIFHDFLEIVCYLFLHRFGMRFGIDFGSILALFRHRFLCLLVIVVFHHLLDNIFIYFLRFPDRKWTPKVSTADPAASPIPPISFHA